MEDRWETVREIRNFNRFYTALSGFLDRDYLHSGYSVTEARILFELRQNGRMSAKQLVDLLYLDKSYVSRIIRGFEQGAVITREADPADRRTQIIRLTSRGEAETERLIERTDRAIYSLIERLDAEACRDLRESMKKITETLSGQGLPREDEP